MTGPSPTVRVPGTRAITVTSQPQNRSVALTGYWSPSTITPRYRGSSTCPRATFHHRLAEQQHGVVNRSQLRIAGLRVPRHRPTRSLRRVEHRELPGVPPCTVQPPALNSVGHRRARCGRRARPAPPDRRPIVGGSSGCPIDPVHVVRAASSRRMTDRAVVHRVRALPARWVTSLSGLPIVRPELLALQLFAACSSGRAERLTDRLWSMRLLSGPSDPPSSWTTTAAAVAMGRPASGLYRGSQGSWLRAAGFGLGEPLHGAHGRGRHPHAAARSTPAGPNTGPGAWTSGTRSSRSSSRSRARPIHRALCDETGRRPTDGAAPGRWLPCRGDLRCDGLDRTGNS